MRRFPFSRTNLSDCGIIRIAHRFIETDPTEQQRETELREKILKRYPGIRVPPMTNFQYGNFASSGGGTLVAGNQAFQNVFGQTPGNEAPQRKVDWFMLLTGTAIVYLTMKIFYQRINRGLDGFDVPMWTASVETQAKHLLFCVQFDPETRKKLKEDFQHIRQADPFADFYEWVRSTRPEYGYGRKYTYDTALSTLVSVLMSGDQGTLTSLARALQSAFSTRGGDSTRRIDDFVDVIQKMGSIPFFATSAPHFGPNYSAATIPITDTTPYPNTDTGVVELQGSQNFNMNDALSAPDSIPHNTKPFA